MASIIKQLCKLCGNTNISVIHNFSGKEIGEFIPRFNKTYKKNFTKDLEIADDDIFSLVRCRSCDFAFIANPLSPEKLHKLYEEIVGLKQSEHRDLFLNIWLDLLSVIKTGQVLDIGCGWGEFLQIGLSLGFDCYGYEFDRKKYSLLKRKGIKMIHDLDKSTTKYDFILLNQVLEHVADPVILAKTCRNLLKSSGRLLVAVPNFSNFQKITKTLNPLEHINYFTPQSLKKLFLSVGFNVRDYYPYRFENWHSSFGITKEIVKIVLNKLAEYSRFPQTTFIYCKIAQ